MILLCVRVRASAHTLVLSMWKSWPIRSVDSFQRVLSTATVGTEHPTKVIVISLFSLSLLLLLLLCLLCKCACNTKFLWICCNFSGFDWISRFGWYCQSARAHRVSRTSCRFSNPESFQYFYSESPISLTSHCIWNTIVMPTPLIFEWIILSNCQRIKYHDRIFVSKCSAVTLTPIAHSITFTFTNRHNYEFDWMKIHNGREDACLTTGNGFFSLPSQIHPLGDY